MQDIDKRQMSTIADLADLAETKGYETLAERLREGSEGLQKKLQKERGFYAGVNPTLSEPILFGSFSDSAAIIKGKGIRGKGRSLTSLYTLMLSPCTCGNMFCFPLRYTNGHPKMLREGDPTDNVFIKCMDCGRQNEARSALESINDWNKSWNALHPDKTYPIYSEYPMEGKEYTQSDK